jgi:hypothetical protein
VEIAFGGLLKLEICRALEKTGHAHEKVKSDGRASRYCCGSQCPRCWRDVTSPHKRSITRDHHSPRITPQLR